MPGKIITCSRGDITQSDAEAIVNAANNYLWMGAGVAGAIKRHGGEEIEKEAVSKGPIPVGEAIATRAGSLPQKYVIHAAAMGQDLITDEVKIRTATGNALLRAEELAVATIDFPALGTGVGGFAVEEAARIMVAEVRAFLENSKLVRRVGFILWDDISFQAFRREIGDNLEV
jgi:O-acetyl-ADP-ribose deacetylase (regulator of RNase III)